MATIKKAFKTGAGFVAMLALAILPTTGVFAANSTDVTQLINGGVLTADILNSSRVPVASPSFAMTATNFSFDCQTSTGTIGSNTQRLYIINPSGTTSVQSWNLSIAGTGTWTNGSDTYAYNDAAGSGCTNGQLTVNPAGGTLTDDCVSTECTSASITLGSSTSMTGSTAVTLLTAPVDTPIYRGYLTNIPLSQKIPAETPTGAYALNMTITAVAS